MKIKRLCSCMLLALLATSANAQKITPGLWEHTVTMKSRGGEMEAAMAQMQEQLARMTPEQRKQMEAMMGGQGMGMMAGKPTTVRTCITAEQAARDEMAPPDKQCTQVSKERSGKTLRIKFACEGERKGTAEGEFTMDSDKAHHGRLVMETVAQGRPQRVEMEQSGRWVSADCGDIKPRTR